MLQMDDLNGIADGVIATLGLIGDSSWSYLREKGSAESWTVAETAIGGIKLRIHQLDDFYILNLIHLVHDENGVIRTVDAYIPYNSDHGAKASILAEAYRKLYLED
ncbi:hypothetical protein JOF50_001093 [Corynebacterium mucifaciens]|uniref:Nuclear transport factor 2 family protein n=2 Tax=Corynebacterium mucifaciens TaxID=57171 RepID=A0ABV2NXH0_9CORY